MWVCFQLVRGGIFDMGGNFVAVRVEMEVEAPELVVVKAFVKLVWGCLNGRIYFLWRLSLILVECKISSIGRRLFSMVMRVAWGRRQVQKWRYGGGGRGGCGGGCEGGLILFGGGVRGGECIDVVVAKGVEMSVGGGGAGNRESALMSGGGGTCAVGGGAS